MGTVGIHVIGVKTERMQIHFLSDVLIGVVLLDLKVPNVGQQSPSISVCGVVYGHL